MTLTALDHPVISDAEKEALWHAYHAGRAARVPVIFKTNARVIHPLPEWNPDGYTFEDTFHDPEAHLKMELQHALYRRRVIGKHSDEPHELPDVWKVTLYNQNVYEAAGFGAEVSFPPEQVPSTEPPFADESNRDAVFDVDIAHPFDSPYWRSRIEMHAQMQKLAEGMTFEGRPVLVTPPWSMSSDGPVTAGCNLRGTDFLMDLLTEPEYAQKLMAFVIEAIAHRRRAMAARFGLPDTELAGAADDSCAMLSVDQWRTLVKPHHEHLYHVLETDGCWRKVPNCRRGIHMCGNATHLFPAMHEELGIMRFDTGFPVDHGKLRTQLGTDVEILGGTEAQLLLQGSPQQVYDRSRDILQSGIKRGRRFTFREGNNLPPLVPEDNLAAMYAAALAFGSHDTI